MPSGKQILLADIQKFSQTKLSKEELSAATERFKAGLLLHGSTPPSAWPIVERMAWNSRDNGPQGPGIANHDIFLAELINTLLYADEIPKIIQENHPELTRLEYRSSLHVIYLLLTQLCYDPSLASVENNGVLDQDEADRLTKGYMKALENFRANPEDQIGCSIENAESDI